VFSQSADWIYVGVTPKFEVYYLKNSVYRGQYTVVTAAGKYLRKETDADGKEYKYATANMTFYKSKFGDIRCILGDWRYYYTDNDYRKGNEKKVEYVITNIKILNDIYNKIK
jgi:hypothetical protein